MSLHRQLKLLPFSVALLLLGNVAQANAQDTKLKWFGHAAFSITTPRGKVLLIDPWLSNPSNPDVKMAAKAAQSLRTRLAIPQHFATFPVLQQALTVLPLSLRS